jgi:hypothetical protein
VACVDVNLYVTADGGRIVSHGDTAAAFLWCFAGREFDEEAAAVLGWPALLETVKVDVAPVKVQPSKAVPENGCGVCGKVAKSAAGLSAHMRSHA